jgi:hypothetical protein
MLAATLHRGEKISWAVGPRLAGIAHRTGYYDRLLAIEEEIERERALLHGVGAVCDYDPVHITGGKGALDDPRQS